MSSIQRSRLGFAIVLLIIIAIGIGAYLNGRQFVEANRSVTHTLQVQRTIAELLTYMVDAETGARGFFLTEEETYLEPYTLALGNVWQVMERLESYIIDNPVQFQRLSALEDAIQLRLDTLEAAIARRRVPDPDNTQTLVTNTGKIQMDDIRAQIAAMQLEEDRLLANRNAEAGVIAQVTFIVYGILTLTAIAMLGIVYVVIQRSFAENKRNEQELEKRVAERTSQLTFLAEASAVLSEPSAYRKKLQQIAQMATPRIADWCVFQIAKLDAPETELEPIAVGHRNPSKLPMLAQQLAHSPAQRHQPGGAYQVFESNKPVFHRDIEAIFAAAPDDPNTAGFRHMGLKSAILVPLTANGKTLGVLTLIMDESKRIYTDADFTLAEEIGNRAALLVENGRLFEYTRQLNSDLEKRVEQRTQQLAAINTELEAFNYSVSHDLRAPLRSIDGFSAALLEDYAESMPATGQNYLKRVRIAAQRMGELIDDLLSLSRLTRVEMSRTTVNLSALAKAVTEDLKRAEPDRTVEIVIAPDLCADSDSHLVKILLENLIGNAWKFTRKVESPVIRFGQTEADGETAFFVADNGAGFDMTYVSRLFGAFERLHSTSDFEGTGIGLATVQRIINRHGGRVWATGEVGKGATFYFTLQGALEKE